MAMIIWDVVLIFMLDIALFIPLWEGPPTLEIFRHKHKNNGPS